MRCTPHTGISSATKISTPCAWQASLSIFGWGMRPPRLWRWGSNPLFRCRQKNKTDHQMMVCFVWQRNRDSNPNIQSQSLLCYRYTIPLSLFSLIIVAQRLTFVKGVFKIYFAFFSFFVFQYEDLNKIERFSPYFPWHQSHFPLNIPRFSRNSLLLRWFSL